MNTDEIEALFDQNHDWDIEEPSKKHKKRFLKKLNKKSKTKRFRIWFPIAVASCFVIGFGILMFNNQANKTVVFSPKVQETHNYFSSVIKNELIILKEKENPSNKILINDALNELQVLEKDYEKLKADIEKNGENKQIVFAMITNMQTRLSFIKSVLEQIENINKLNNQNNENHL